MSFLRVLYHMMNLVHLLDVHSQEVLEAIGDGWDDFRRRGRLAHNALDRGEVLTALFRRERAPFLADSRDQAWRVGG